MRLIAESEHLQYAKRRHGMGFTEREARELREKQLRREIESFRKARKSPNEGQTAQRPIDTGGRDLPKQRNEREAAGRQRRAVDVGSISQKRAPQRDISIGLQPTGDVYTAEEKKEEDKSPKAAQTVTPHDHGEKAKAFAEEKPATDVGGSGSHGGGERRPPTGGPGGVDEPGKGKEPKGEGNGHEQSAKSGSAAATIGPGEERSDKVNSLYGDFGGNDEAIGDLKAAEAFMRLSRDEQEARGIPDFLNNQELLEPQRKYGKQTPTSYRNAYQYLSEALKEEAEKPVQPHPAPKDVTPPPATGSPFLQGRVEEAIDTTEVTITRFVPVQTAMPEETQAARKPEKKPSVPVPESPQTGFPAEPPPAEKPAPSPRVWRKPSVEAANAYYDQLLEGQEAGAPPLVVNVTEVARVLGISRRAAREGMEGRNVTAITKGELRPKIEAALLEWDKQVKAALASGTKGTVPSLSELAGEIGEGVSIPYVHAIAGKLATKGDITIPKDKSIFRDRHPEHVVQPRPGPSPETVAGRAKARTALLRLEELRKQGTISRLPGSGKLEEELGVPHTQIDFVKKQLINEGLIAGNIPSAENPNALALKAFLHGIKRSREEEHLDVPVPPVRDLAAKFIIHPNTVRRAINAEGLPKAIDPRRKSPVSERFAGMSFEQRVDRARIGLGEIKQAMDEARAKGATYPLPSLNSLEQQYGLDTRTIRGMAEGIGIIREGQKWIVARGLTKSEKMRDNFDWYREIQGLGYDTPTIAEVAREYRVVYNVARRAALKSGYAKGEDPTTMEIIFRLAPRLSAIKQGAQDPGPSNADIARELSEQLGTDVKPGRVSHHARQMGIRDSRVFPTDEILSALREREIARRNNVKGLKSNSQLAKELGVDRDTIAKYTDQVIMEFGE